MWVEDRSRKDWSRMSYRVGKEGRRMEVVGESGKARKGKAQETVKHSCPYA